MAAGWMESLEPDLAQRVRALMVRKRYQTKEVLFHEGDLGDALHFIDRGRVAVRATTPDGDVATLAVLGPGLVFGEQALLSPESRRTATIVALEPVETHALSGVEFARLRASHPEVDQLLINLLGVTVRRLSQQLIEALYVPVEKRLARRLLSLGEEYADSNGNAPVPLTQDDIASMAGATRQTANAVLRALQRDGIIELGRRRVEIVDLAELQKRAR